MDLVEVEVAQRQPGAGEQPRHRVRGRHQQAIAAVHEVDRRGLGVHKVRQDGQPALLGPLLGGEQHHRGAVGQRRGVARRHRRVGVAQAVHRLELGELLHAGVRAQVLVAGQAEVGRHQVVEETPVVRGREPLVRFEREGVLRLAGDAPLPGGDRRVLAHGESGPRLGVTRDLRPERLGGAQPGGRAQPPAERAGPVELQQRAPHVLVELQRRVRGGVHPAGDARLDLAERDLVGHRDRRLQAGAAGLLHVVGRGVRVQPRTEHALPGQVEVAGVLEHRTGDHLAEPLPGQPEPGHQAVQRGGEHVLIGRPGVPAVRARERDPVPADDRDPSLRHFSRPPSHSGSAPTIAPHPGLLTSRLRL